VIRFIVGLITIVFTLFFISAQILGLSYIMQSVTKGALTPKLAILIVSIILAIYIAAGGFRAVAWTDAFQVILVIGGIVATFIVVVAKFDLASIFKAVQTTRGGIFTTPGPIPAYKPGLWITSFFAMGLSFVFMPQLWVRVYASKHERGLRNIVVYFIAGTAVMFFMTYVFSVVCAEIYAGKGIQPDKLTLSLIFDHFPDWFAGTILIGVVAASMSTVDSQVLALSSIAVRDFYSKQFKPDRPKPVEAALGRMISVVILGGAVYFAFFPPAKMLWSLLIDVMYPGIMSLVPATLLGLFWKKASRAGALVSLVVGAGFAIVMIAYNFKPFGFHQAFWVLIASGVTFVLGSLISPPAPGKRVDLIASISE
jgi:Na+/proline symporter